MMQLARFRVPRQVLRIRAKFCFKSTICGLRSSLHSSSPLCGSSSPLGRLPRIISSLTIKDRAAGDNYGLDVGFPQHRHLKFFKNYCLRRFEFLVCVCTEESCLVLVFDGNAPPVKSRVASLKDKKKVAAVGASTSSGSSNELPKYRYLSSFGDCINLRWMKKASLKEDDKSLLVDHLPSDDEWIVDEDTSRGSGSSQLATNYEDTIDVDAGDDVDVNDGDGYDDHDRGSARVRGRGRASGHGRGRGRQQGQKRKFVALEKGKGLRLIDEELYEDDYGEEEDLNFTNDFSRSDGDDEGGDHSGYDPSFKPWNTDDSLLN